MTARRACAFSRDRRSMVAVSSGGAPPPFSPADLAGNVLLMRLDDTSTLRQDSAGTTAVTADGDPIGRAADQSTAARVYTASGLARPLYRTAAMTGPRACAQGDGTDDGLIATVAWGVSGAQTWTFDFQLTTASPGFSVGLYAGNGTAFFILAFTSALGGGYASISWRCNAVSAGNSVGYNVAYDTNRHRMVIVYDGNDHTLPSSYRLWWDGVEVTVVASGPLSYASSGASICSRPDGVPAPVRMRRIAVHSAAYPAQATNLDGWLNA